jgi:two-component system response regulator FixJ
VNELIVVPVNSGEIDSAKKLLAGCRLGSRIYDNLEAWVADSNAHQQAVGNLAEQAMTSVNGNGHWEQCLLLVGPLQEMAEKRLAERVDQVHPGLPVVAAGDSPALEDVVRLVRQGVFNVIDLRLQEVEPCKTLEAAVNRGRETLSDRLRTIELRQRLATLTQAERQVLDAMMDGHANKETAKLLGIGLRTVELRRAKIMTKMGAKGVAELIKLFCVARCPGLDTRAGR